MGSELRSERAEAAEFRLLSLPDRRDCFFAHVGGFSLLSPRS
jgi:hypothetical protein